MTPKWIVKRKNTLVSGFRENQLFQSLLKRRNRENAGIKENNPSLYGNLLTFLFNYQSGYNQGDKEKADKVGEDFRVETGHSRDNEQ